MTNEPSLSATQGSQTRKRRFRLRFSLFTLLAMTMLIGSSILFWTQWRPWKPRASLNVHPYGVKYVAYSPDGTRIISNQNNPDFRLIIWDAYTGAIVHENTLTGWVVSPSFSADGKTILLIDANLVRTFDLTTGSEALCHAETDLPMHPQWATFSPNGEKVLFVTYAGQVVVLNSRTGKENLNFKGHDRRIYFAAFSPSGQEFITCSEDKTAKIWESDSGRLLLTLAGHDDTVSQASYSPDGSMIATAGYGCKVNLWRRSDGGLLQTFQEPSGYVSQLRFSSDGKKLYFAGHDGSFRIWNLGTGNLEAAISGPYHFLWSVSVSRSEERIATATNNPDLYIWDMKGALLAQLPGHKKDINCVDFSPDGKSIATASEDGTIRIWDNCRPESCFGIIVLPSFWLTMAFGLSVIWSVWRDQKPS